jgi:hypothetical protein
MFLRALLLIGVITGALGFTWSRISSGRMMARSSIQRDGPSKVLGGTNGDEGVAAEEKHKDAAPSAGFSYSAAAAQLRSSQSQSSKLQLREARDQKKSLTALGMGVLDDIKKIVAGGDPNEVLAAENDSQVKKYMQVVEQINDLEEQYENLSDDELKAKTEQFRAKLDSGASLESILVEAFAVVSTEAAEVEPFHRFP